MSTSLRSAGRSTSSRTQTSVSGPAKWARALVGTRPDCSLCSRTIAVEAAVSGEARGSAVSATCPPASSARRQRERVFLPLLAPGRRERRGEERRLRSNPWPTLYRADPCSVSRRIAPDTLLLIGHVATSRRRQACVGVVGRIASVQWSGGGCRCRAGRLVHG